MTTAAINVANLTSVDNRLIAGSNAVTGITAINVYLVIKGTAFYSYSVVLCDAIRPAISASVAVCPAAINLLGACKSTAFNRYTIAINRIITSLRVPAINSFYSI